MDDEQKETLDFLKEELDYKKMELRIKNKVLSEMQLELSIRSGMCDDYAKEFWSFNGEVKAMQREIDEIERKK